MLYDVVVVGGGIIGLATARELLARHPFINLAFLSHWDRRSTPSGSILCPRC